MWLWSLYWSGNHFCTSAKMQGENSAESYFFLLYFSTFSPFSTSIRSQALTWVACWRKCRSWSSNSELHLLIKASSWAYDITGAVLTRDNTRISFCNLTERNISHVKSFVPGCDDWSRGGGDGGWCSRCCSLQPQSKASSNSSASSSYTTHTHTQIIQITERKIAMIPLLIAVLWPQLFVQHALLSRAWVWV